LADLQSLIEKTVNQLGFELVDLELSNRGKLIRVFIDKPESITIDDCVLVSNQLGNQLAVEQAIDYDRLEVSSPGMDRVLKKTADFVRFVGSKASIKTKIPMDGRKNYIGVLRGVLSDNVVQIEVDGVLIEIPFSNIDKARLVPEF
jgi:ribosome maturation factor RimP